MNLPIDKYPTEGSANENVLFSTLGAFWTQIFTDRAAIKGMTMAQAEEVCQSYYDLLEAIDSYSADHIHIFKKIKWFPILIKASELSSNVLKFGEGVKFAEQVDGESYYFGKAMPQEHNVFIIDLPENLKEVSLLANRVISPDAVLVNNIDIQIKGSHLYFYGNPFNLPNVSVTDLIDADGNPVYYEDPLTQQKLPERLLVLWAYNAKINRNSLNYNIAYLFGVQIPTTEQSKNILAAVVKLLANPSIYKIKALCGAFLGLKPILESIEEVVDIRQTATHTIVTTDQHVYKYDIYYTLNPTVKVGSVLAAGDLPVDGVEFYDALTFKNWWLSKMSPKIFKTLNQELKSPNFALAPHMFAGSKEFGLIFKNSMELITRDTSGYVKFPVEGVQEDINAFNRFINQPTTLEHILGAIGGLSIPDAKILNPLDFLFTNLLQYNSAMVKINFKTLEQLQLFTQLFPIIKHCLPSHVYFIFFFDIEQPVETYELEYAYSGADLGLLTVPWDMGLGVACWAADPKKAPCTVHEDVAQQSDNVSLNATDSESSLCVLDEIQIRTYTGPITTKDVNVIELTKDPRPDLV